MARPAVPQYLGRDFQGCPPGHLFTLYGAFWGEGWTRVEHIDPDRDLRELRQPLRQVSPEGAKLQEALVERQRVAARQAPARLYAAEARTTAPFVTGTGIEHPLENGMAFLNPYGLPYLPGSSVKGVLRRAARELASGEWGEARGWSEDKRYRLPVRGNLLSLSVIDVLFGLESRAGEVEHTRGALSFWDVHPRCERLDVDIMNPHYGEYYRGKEPPHDAGNPIPIYFLVLPAGTPLTFHIELDPVRLPPDWDQDWRGLLDAALDHAFTWCGFGAKTSLGYGAMEVDSQAQEEARARAEAREREEAERRRIAEATRDLPEDAAWVEQRRAAGAWADTNAFLADVEKFLEGRTALSAQAYDRLTEELEARWKGISADPDAVQGKKRKPKFKERPKGLAKRLLSLKPDGTP